jgi:hypothetical protein
MSPLRGWRYRRRDIKTSELERIQLSSVSEKINYDTDLLKLNVSDLERQIARETYTVHACDQGEKSKPETGESS